MHKLLYVSLVTGIDAEELKSLIESKVLVGNVDSGTWYIEPVSLEKYLIGQGRQVPDVFKAGRANLLIVDDDESMLKSLQRLFARFSSLSIHTASNAYEMGYRMNTVRPDVIILDYNMPGMDGRKVVQELKNDAAFKDMKIIIFTGRSEDETEEEFAGFQNVRVIKKTADFLELIGGVESLLRK